MRKIKNKKKKIVFCWTEQDTKKYVKSRINDYRENIDKLSKFEKEYLNLTDEDIKKIIKKSTNYVKYDYSHYQAIEEDIELAMQEVIIEKLKKQGKLS